MKNFVLIAMVAALALGGSAASAKDTFNSTAAIRALATTPAAELPAAAAKIVTSAPEKSRAAVVGSVVRKIARTNPVALHHVVAAISKADPSLASTAAAAASKANPEATSLLATAACSAAPDKAAEILAVCARVSGAPPRSLATDLAIAHPAFSAELLTRQSSALDITSDAAVITGGTVISGLIPPGSLGQDLNGTKITTAPTPIGPGRPGFDPDRYASP